MSEKIRVIDFTKIKWTFRAIINNVERMVDPNGYKLKNEEEQRFVTSVNNSLNGDEDLLDQGSQD